MAEIEDYKNWDYFFYYGQIGLEEESKNDLWQLILQPKRSLYYNRRESAGINEYENRPNGIDLQIFARFEIANAVAYRNTLVTNGTDNTIDRRIAVSQNSIGFEARGGELDIQILYFLFADYEEPRSVNFALIK